MYTLYKKIYFTFVLFAVMFSSSFAFAESSLTLEPAQVNARVDEVFTVDLLMSSIDEPINAVSVDVHYDTDVMDLLSYRRSTEEVSFWIDNSDDPFDGNIVIEGLLIGQGWQGSREKLGSLTFKVKGASNTAIAIDNAALHAYDGTGRNIIDVIGYTDVIVSAGAPREEYEYKYSGAAPVETHSRNSILYEDEYVREYRAIHIFPWWSLVLFGISLVLFAWSVYAWRTIKKNTPAREIKKSITR